MGRHGWKSERVRGRDDVEASEDLLQDTVFKDIQHFLERRVRLLRETSDSLAQLAREKLLDAR